MSDDGVETVKTTRDEWSSITNKDIRNIYRVPVKKN